MNKMARIKPAKGFSQFIHLMLVSILPMALYVTVSMAFEPLAYGLVLLSKWRMLAVKPRHWPANIRANAVDIIVGLSFVSFMIQAPTGAWRLAWALMYGVWLLLIKPRSTVLWTSVQAAIGQTMGLSAIYVLWGRSPLAVLVVSTWAVCYLSARHFFTSYDEPYSSLMAHLWGYFGAALTWLLGHWLLYYGFIAQPTLILTVIASGMTTLYYLESTDRLSALVRREVMLVMSIVILVVILFSDWSDKAI